MEKKIYFFFHNFLSKGLLSEGKNYKLHCLGSIQSDIEECCQSCSARQGQYLKKTFKTFIYVCFDIRLFSSLFDCFRVLFFPR